MFEIKRYRFILALFLCISTLMGCTRIELKKDCVPGLTYSFPENSHFMFLDASTGKLGEFFANNELPHWYVMSYRESSSNHSELVIPFYAKQLTLTGRVLEYHKNWASFKNDGVYFEVDINDKTAWMNGVGLSLVSSKYSNESNQTKFADGYGMHGSFKCIENNN